MKGWISLLMVFWTQWLPAQTDVFVSLGGRATSSLSLAGDAPLFPYNYALGGEANLSINAYHVFIEGHAGKEWLFDTNIYSERFLQYRISWGVGFYGLLPKQRSSIGIGAIRIRSEFCPDPAAFPPGEEVPPPSFWLSEGVRFNYYYQLLPCLKLSISAIRTRPEPWDPDNFFSFLMFGIKYEVKTRHQE